MIHVAISLSVAIVCGSMLHYIGYWRGKEAADSSLVDALEQWESNSRTLCSDEWSKGYRSALCDVVRSLKEK